MRDFVEKGRARPRIEFLSSCEPGGEEGTRGLWITRSASSFPVCPAGFRERPETSVHFGSRRLNSLRARKGPRAAQPWFRF